jgi:hypothetical protein
MGMLVSIDVFGLRSVYVSGGGCWGDVCIKACVFGELENGSEALNWPLLKLKSCWFWFGRYPNGAGTLSDGVLTDAVDAVAGLVVLDRFMPSTRLPDTTEAVSDGELAVIGTSPSLSKILMQAWMRL